jgi:hypothetical protein
VCRKCRPIRQHPPDHVTRLASVVGFVKARRSLRNNPAIRASLLEFR